MVSSTPAGIDCGENCSVTYPDGMQVTLSASPLADCTFRGTVTATDPGGHTPAAKCR